MPVTERVYVHCTECERTYRVKQSVADKFNGVCPTCTVDDESAAISPAEHHQEEDAGTPRWLNPLIVFGLIVWSFLAGYLTSSFRELMSRSPTVSLEEHDQLHDALHDLVLYRTAERNAWQDAHLLNGGDQVPESKVQQHYQQLIRASSR